MDHSTLIVASISRPELNLWVNGSIATMIAGSLFFFFGAIIGWWMWKQARTQSLETAEINTQLVKEYKQRNQDFNNLTDQLASVTDQVDALKLR